MSIIMNTTDFATQFIHLLKNDDAFRANVRNILGHDEAPMRVVPSAASYRIPPGDVNHSKCIGRINKGGEDKRWKPAVYRERQCGKDVSKDGLCNTCAIRCEKYDGKEGVWNGRITEEPLDWLHMLGMAWAMKKKPVFIGTVVVDPKKEAAKAEKEAAKAEKEAAKVAKKEAVKAEKEAAKVAKEAAKVAKKEAVKAEKEAAKVAKKEAKEKAE
jgi:hypothetical protein